MSLVGIVYILWQERPKLFHFVRIMSQLYLVTFLKFSASNRRRGGDRFESWAETAS